MQTDGLSNVEQLCLSSRLIGVGHMDPHFVISNVSIGFLFDVREKY